MEYSTQLFSALRRGALATLMTLATVLPGHSDDTPPVVVELFTSQGCSSCPPADALLHELAKQPEVIALSLHVDYWDYIGWKDGFALPGHGERQKSYAHLAGRRMVYTPQIVVNGVDTLNGTKPMALEKLIRAHSAKPAQVALSVARPDTQSVQVEIAPAETQVDGPMDLVIVLYSPSEKVDIRRGENAGRTISYTNVVQSWHPMGRWSGQASERFTLNDALRGDGVVLVQRAGNGPIVAAARLP